MKRLIPFFLLFALLAILAKELFYAKTTELPSTLMGEKLPAFSLPILFDEQQTLTQNDLIGQIALLNIWATWCYACGIEHDMLLKINKDYHVPIFGIVYKDEASNAKDWLVRNGNPYSKIGEDKKGDFAIDLGVYGTPETFLLNKEGKIIYRYVGNIDEKAWNDVLYPQIKKLKEKG